MTDSASSSYRWVILLLLVMSFFVTFSAISPVLGPLMKTLISELEITRAEGGLILTVFSLAQMITILPSGAVVDRYGVKRLYGAATVVLGFLVFIIGFSRTYHTMLAFIFVAGLLYSVQGILRMKATVEWFSRTERATANAIIVSCLSIAPLVFTPLVTYLTTVLGVRWGLIFHLMGVVIVITGFILFLTYKDPPSTAGPFSSNPTSTGRFSGGAFKRLITNRDVVFCHLGFALTVGVYQTTMTWGMLFLLEQIRLEPMVAASVMMVWSFAGTFRWAGGLISDKIARGRRKLTCAPAAFLESLFCLSILLLSSDSPMLLIMALFFMVGFMRAMWGGPGNIWGIEIAPRELVASSAALQGLLSLVASACFPLAVGWIVDMTGSFHYAWLTVGLVEALIATPLWLMVREEK